MSADRYEQLVDRILNRQIEARDLDELAQLSQNDPQALTQIAATLRATATIESGVQTAESIAASVELPDNFEIKRSATNPIVRWSGWSAAAMLAAAWLLVAILKPTLPSVNESISPNILLTANEALEQYMRAGMAEGRIIEELPLLTVDLRPAEDGEGMDVFYIRRVIEKAHVKGMYKMGMDDQGRAVVLPTDEISSPSREAL
ncbi:MAG: hypothetical protein IH984_03955 [Planctomycetes bacterium]|nr:hypothetical protein [Planctomycetota bacterium]